MQWGSMKTTNKLLCSINTQATVKTGISFNRQQFIGMFVSNNICSYQYCLDCNFNCQQTTFMQQQHFCSQYVQASVCTNIRCMTLQLADKRGFLDNIVTPGSTSQVTVIFLFIAGWGLLHNNNCSKETKLQPRRTRHTCKNV